MELLSPHKKLWYAPARSPIDAVHEVWEVDPCLPVHQFRYCEIHTAAPIKKSYLRLLANRRRCQNYWAFTSFIQVDPVRDQFQKLAAEWRAGTKFTPTLRKMVMHDAYQRIIALGKPVVRYILRDMESEPDHWFWALHYITGEDPAQGCETIEGATAAWLQWGRNRGYIS